MSSILNNVVRASIRTHDDILLVGSWTISGSRRAYVWRSDDFGQTWFRVWLEGISDQEMPIGFGISTDDEHLYYFGRGDDMEYNWYKTDDNTSGSVTANAYPAWTYDTWMENPTRIGNYYYAGMTPYVNGVISGLDIGYSSDGINWSTAHEWHNDRVYREYMNPWTSFAYHAGTDTLWAYNWNYNVDWASGDSAIVYNPTPRTNPTNWINWTFDTENLTGLVPYIVYSLTLDDTTGEPAAFSGSADYAAFGTPENAVFGRLSSGLYDVWIHTSDTIVGHMDHRSDDTLKPSAQLMYCMVAFAPGTYVGYSTDTTVDQNGYDIKTVDIYPSPVPTNSMYPMVLYGYDVPEEER